MAFIRLRSAIWSKDRAGKLAKYAPVFILCFKRLRFQTPESINRQAVFAQNLLHPIQHFIPHVPWHADGVFGSGVAIVDFVVQRDVAGRDVENMLPPSKPTRIEDGHVLTFAAINDVELQIIFISGTDHPKEFRSTVVSHVDAIHQTAVVAPLL